MHNEVYLKLIEDKKARDSRIGKAVKQKRVRLLLSQRELASILDVSRSTISGWETGCGISDGNLGKIKDFLEFEMPCGENCNLETAVGSCEMSDGTRDALLRLEKIATSIVYLTQSVLQGDKSISNGV